MYFSTVLFFTLEFSEDWYRDHLLSYIQLLEPPPLHLVRPIPVAEKPIPKEEKKVKFRQKLLLDEITFLSCNLVA